MANFSKEGGEALEIGKFDSIKIGEGFNERHVKRAVPRFNYSGPINGPSHATFLSFAFSRAHFEETIVVSIVPWKNLLENKVITRI